MPAKRKKVPQGNKGLQIDALKAIELNKEIEERGKLEETVLVDSLHVDSKCAASEEARKSCKGGPIPSCLCGMIPAPESFRRSGLWAKKPSVLGGSELQEANPASSKRAPATPVGLCNLGNTCYINSVLQCLFAIKEFRNSILCASMPQLDHHDVVHQLREIFVQMQCGPVDRVDPTGLVQALRVDHSVQQDGQEFMKLFLTLLERAFEDTTELKDMISTLFKGKSGYQTRCMTCQQLSSGSHRLYDFSELDIPIKGFKSLHDSLGALLSPEILEGDNQYNCEHCNGKRDATRQLIIRQLPPILCLSLQRFVFDMKKMDRVKVNDKFSFPLEVNASMLAHQHRGERVTYDLRGILLHKGNSARQGHYVAHIYESEGEETGWWRFDDVDVSKFASGPWDHTDHGIRPKPSAKGPDPKRKRSITHSPSPETSIKENFEVDIDLTEDAVVLEDTRGEKEGKCTEAPTDVSSSNAYLLVYRVRNCDQSSALKVDDQTEKWVASKKQQMKENFKSKCEAHARLVAETVSSINARRAEVRGLIDSCCTRPEGDSGCFIFSSWLQTWADAQPGEVLESIDNKPLLCNHGKLDPSRIQASKRISKHAWEHLQSSYGGGPELTLEDICYRCLKDQLKAIIAAEDVAVNRQKYLELSDQLDNGEADHGVVNSSEGYYVGRQWFRGWRNKKGLTMGSTAPTATLICPHGGLQPDIPGRPSKRICIPPDFWEYLKRSWYAKLAEKDRKDRFKMAESAGKPSRGQKKRSVGDSTCELIKSDSMSRELDLVKKEVDLVPDSEVNNEEMVQPNQLQEIRWDCPECKICLDHLNKEMSLHDLIGGRKDQERAHFKPLIVLRPTVELIPGVIYNLVPMAFMEQWRNYISGSNKVSHGKSLAEPPSLKECMARVLCDGHNGEAISPLTAYGGPEVISRRGRWMALNEKDGAFEIISSLEWQGLWSMYGDDAIPVGVKGITAVLSCRAVESDQVEKKGMEVKLSNEPLPIPEDIMTVKGQLSSLDAPMSKIKGPQPDQLAPEIQSQAPSKELTLAQPSVEDIACCLEINPAICARCINDRSEALKAAILNFEDKEVMVECVKDAATAMTSTLPDPQQQSVPKANANKMIKEKSNTQIISIKERKSKRARKGRCPIRVDCTTTLENFALRVFEGLGIHPLNLRIFAKGIELTDRSKTMLEYEIYPSEEIRVVDSEVHDANDLSSLFPDKEHYIGKEEEKGFTGTALVG